MDGYFNLHSPGWNPILDFVARGVYERARERKCGWMIERLGRNLGRADLEGCRGMLALIWDESMAGAARELGFPVVNLSNTGGDWEGLANVLSDDLDVGRVAARHLLGRGFRSVIAVGLESRVFSTERAGGFCEEALRAGARAELVNVGIATMQRAWMPETYFDELWESLAPVFRRLQPPVGVFCVNDWLGWAVWRAIERGAPEQFHTTGLIGADNLHGTLFDPLRTEGLSSVAPGFREAGRRGLDVLMDCAGGKKNAAEVRVRCRPEGVIERASTAGPACSDPLAALVVRDIWSGLRSGEPVILGDLAKKRGMTLRTLERKFSSVLGRSAREWLAKMRIEYACELLKNPGAVISEVAGCCGFADTPAFSAAFKKTMGRTPREWRGDRSSGR